MDLKVFWTETARNQLEEINNYYRFKASIKVAQKLINQILDKALILKTQPQAGQVELLLKHRKYEYRYLIQGNYKIIYWIEDNYIKIASVFDCRQNPNKIKSEIDPKV
jgi:plasmid stabilization system protein ParE